MQILGIETSCDDTAAAVIQSNRNKVSVLSNIISSQIKTHAKHGGVVPNLAAREHLKNLPRVLRASLKKAKTNIKNIDIIAVTSGPGLMPALLTGTSFAKALAWKYQKPLIGINHIEGHIYSNYLPRKDNEAGNVKLDNKSIFPALCLIVSGGHTQLILIKAHNKYRLVGTTVDDAAGEAFDKIARIINLPYPGGPALADEADKKEMRGNGIDISLPRPMIRSKNYNFSFAGLKTSALYLARDLKRKYPMEKIKKAIAEETQDAIVDVLARKTRNAARAYNVNSIMLCGGVSANRKLRKKFLKMGDILGKRIIIPDMRYSTDNAAMVAMAALAKIKTRALKPKLQGIIKTKANANWEIA